MRDKNSAGNVEKSMPALSCRLTTAELRERKATVIAALKRSIIDRRELKNGYAFSFAGSDVVLDQLVEFIKSERDCCSFFRFRLNVAAADAPVTLEITGDAGAKAFMQSELGL